MHCYYDLPTYLYGCIRLHRREPDGCAHLHRARRHAGRQTLSAAPHARQTALLYPLRTLLLTHAVRATGGQALFQTAKEHQTLSHALSLPPPVRRPNLPPPHRGNMGREARHPISYADGSGSSERRYARLVG